MPPWDKPKPWETTANPQQANETLNNGLMFNATPAEAEAIISGLTQEEQDFQLATIYFDQRRGTNHTPDMVQANMDYELGEGTTAGQYIQMAKKGAKHEKGTGEVFGKSILGGIPETFLNRAAGLYEMDAGAKRALAKMVAPKGESDKILPTLLRHGWAKILEGQAIEMEETAEIAHEDAEIIFKGLGLTEEDRSRTSAQIGNGLAQLSAMPLYAIPPVGIGTTVAQFYDEGFRDTGSHADATLYTATAAPVGIIADKLIIAKGGLKAIAGNKPIAAQIAKNVVALGKKAGINFASEGISETIEDTILQQGIKGEEINWGQKLKTLWVSGIVGAVGGTGSSLVQSGRAPWTYGDAVRTSKQNTNEEIDAIVEGMDIPAEQKPLAEEMLKTPTEQSTEAFNAWEPEAVTTPEGEEVTLGEGFVKKEIAEGKRIFHGTEEVFEDFDVSKSADGTIWFTDDKTKIEKGEVAASGKGQIMERIIDENNLKLGGWSESDKFSTDELIQQGYDGLKLVDGDETTYQIFFPDKLQTPVDAQQPKPDQEPVSAEKVAPAAREGALDESQALDMLPSAPLQEIGERAQKILDIGEKAKDVIKPMLSVTTRIKEIAPKVQMAIRRADQKVHDIITANTKQSSAFIESVKKIDKGMSTDERAVLHSEILNGDWAALEARGIQGIAEIRQMFTETADALGIPSIENYFRRRVKDHEGLVKYFGENPRGEFKRALDDSAKKKGRALTKQEKTRAIRGVLQQGKGDGLNQKRTIETVTPEMAQFYESPLTELSAYIRTTAQSIARKEELGIEPVISDELADVDDSISEESISSIISDMVGEGKLDAKQESELKELLKSRLDFRGAGKVGSAYRRLVSLKYVTKLKTVVKQFGDYFVGIGENKIDGIAPVGEAQNWKDELGKAVKLNLEEIGVNALDIELQDQGSKRLEDIAFKPLTMADVAGKTVLLKGTARRWRRLAKSNPKKLSKILMDKFQHQEFVDKIIADMKTDTMTADVRFALFSQLADFHPISHSEHIKAYIDHPNTRPLFVLKSFQFKRLDRLFRESLKFGIEGTSEFIAGKVDGNEVMADEGAHKVAKGVMGMSRFLVYSVGAEVALEMTYAKIMRELGFKEEPEEPEDAMWTNMYMSELGKVIPFADPYAIEQAIERDDAWAFVEKIAKPAKPIGFDALKSLSKGLTDDDYGMSLDEYTTWKKDIPWLGEFLWGAEKVRDQ